MGSSTRESDRLETALLFPVFKHNHIRFLGDGVGTVSTGTQKKDTPDPSSVSSGNLLTSCPGVFF